MKSTDREIKEITSRIEQQKVKELGEILQLQPTLIMGMPSTNFSKIIAEELNLDYGNALSIVFWLQELLKMASDAPEDKNIYSSPTNRQRTTHLGRLIQIAGARKALNFCFSKIPEYVQPDLKAVWDEDTNWKKRRN